MGARTYGTHGRRHPLATHAAVGGPSACVADRSARGRGPAMTFVKGLTMKFALGWGLAAVALLALSGCKTIRSASNSCHKVRPYSAATCVPPLRIPSGLDPPETTTPLHAPKLKDPTPPPPNHHPPPL